MPDKREAVIEPLDQAIDYVRGPGTATLIVEYGDYECPYSCQAYREIELGLDVARFERDRCGEAALERVRRDVRSGVASGEVHGTPTLFIDGILHRGGHDAAALLEALAR